MGTGCSLCENHVQLPDKIDGSHKVLIRDKRVLEHTASESIDSMYRIETRKGGIIAVGSIGTIYKAYHKKKKNLLAVKQIAKVAVVGEAWRQEVEMLKRMDHPHVCKLYETWEDSKNVYLVMELCRGCNILTVSQRHDQISEMSMALLVRQMTGAVAHLHNLEFVHGDLRPENWLFTEPVATIPSILDLNLKMIDFGIVAKQALEIKTGGAGAEATRKMKPIGETRGIYCRSPEQHVGARRPNPESDIWAVGCLSFMLLCGHGPFPRGRGGAIKDEDMACASFKFEPCDVWSHVSAHAIEFINTCLQAEPSKRLDAEGLLASSWMVEGFNAFNKQFDSKNNSADALVKGRRNALDSRLPSSEYIAGHFKKMHQLNGIEKAAMTSAAHRLPPSKIAYLRKCYEHMDKNGDGVLTPQELHDGLLGSGMADEELQELLKDIDTDGNGVIDYTEFIAATYEFQRTMQEDMLWSVFRIFDVDGSGSVTKQELKEALVGMDTDEVEDCFQGQSLEEILQELDADGSGEISFKEFKGLFNHDDAR